MATAARPRVKTNVMMITTSGKESGLPAKPLSDLESEAFAIKGDGSVQIRDFEMHVADRNAVRYRAGG